MTRTKPKVSIIVVNWNGGQIFNDCLKSLSKLQFSQAELIIVDNGSSDGSQYLYRKIKLPFQRCTLIENATNVGFAPANNQALSFCRGEYILLLNNDTKVDPKFLKLLVDKMDRDPTIGAMQPKIFLMDRVKYLDNAGSFLTPSGFLQHWGFFQKDGFGFDSEREIFSAKGACLLTRRSIINITGLFDDDFISYFEETDFCWRVWLLGFRVIYFPDAFIFHKLGVTSKKMNQFSVNYHSFKNRLSTLFKNLSLVNLVIILLPHLIIILVLAIYYIFKFDWQKCVMILKSIGWNVMHCSSLINKRLKVQRFRRVSDRVLFDKIMQPVSMVEMFRHFQKVEANFKR